MAYILDADVFIRAKNDYYSFDTVPAFWEWLEVSNAQGRVFSIQSVRDELLAGEDDLAVWTGDRDEAFFLIPDEGTPGALRNVAAWVNSVPQYRPAAVSSFLSGADYFLVAEALNRGFTVVTNEKPAPYSEANVKLPDACRAMGVEYLNPFQMLKVENAVFVLP